MVALPPPTPTSSTAATTAAVVVHLVDVDAIAICMNVSIVGIVGIVGILLVLLVLLVLSAALLSLAHAVFTAPTCSTKHRYHLEVPLLFWVTP
jgi:hypothetical protein